MELEKKDYSSSPKSFLNRASFIVESVLNFFKETPQDLQIKESDDKEIKLAKINAIGNLQGQKIQASVTIIDGGISLIKSLVDARKELEKFEREFQREINKYNDKLSDLKNRVDDYKKTLDILQSQSNMLFKKAMESENYEVIDKVLEINNQIIKLLAYLTHLNIESWKTR